MKREWRDVVETAKALGMYRIKVFYVAAAGGHQSCFTVFCLATGVCFSCGGGMEYEDDDGEEEEDGQETKMPALGHGGEGTDLVPRMIEALAGKKVIGATAGYDHTVVWTEEGELFTFGHGGRGQATEGNSLSLCRGWSLLSKRKCEIVNSNYYHYLTLGWTHDQYSTVQYSTDLV